jgi:glycosyltransferase involved in cell wall biosynthesis
MMTVAAKPPLAETTPSGPSTAIGTAARVAILLGTFNGERFLEEQLASIERQTHGNWRLFAADDGSHDGTWAILERFRRALPEGRVSLRLGPGRGFAANFLGLVCAPDIEAEAFAYCDQDDIWEADKHARAQAWLTTIPTGVPALYASRSRLVDASGRAFGLSPLPSRPPCFANALAQNIASGNTMVFNRAARSLLMQAGAEAPVPAHDWWTYIAVTGCGGVVHVDPMPTLRYRQHGGNAIGHDVSWSARLRRLRNTWLGSLRRMNEGNLAALACLRDRLTDDNRRTLDHLEAMRSSVGLTRLLHLRLSGLHRQTKLGDLSLWVLAATGRL